MAVEWPEDERVSAWAKDEAERSVFVRSPSHESSELTEAEWAGSW